MRKTYVLVLLFVCSSLVSLGQTGKYDIGIRLQHTVNFYRENGIAIQHSNPKWKYDQLYFGVHYVSSRLGTAFGSSNAIKQDNLLLSAAYFLRKDKIIRPYFRLNTGLFWADYESELFDVLDHQSFLCSTEIGVGIGTPWKVKLMSSLGYNLLTGDGVNGPGTLYPVFLQTTMAWTFDIN